MPVGQAFLIERTTLHKKSGKRTCELAYGVTSKTEDQATAAQVLQDNRGHWTIENSGHHIIDWNYEAKIEAASARATDPITSHDCAVLPWALSKPRKFVVSLKKCAN